MDPERREQIALHRWAVIAEATAERLTPGERGALVRALAAQPHTDPDGTVRRYSRATLDRFHEKATSCQGRRGGRASFVLIGGSCQCAPEHVSCVG